MLDYEGLVMSKRRLVTDGSYARQTPSTDRKCIPCGAELHSIQSLLHLIGSGNIPYRIVDLGIVQGRNDILTFEEYTAFRVLYKVMTGMY